ncbi:MAG: hypothetical protein GY851_09445 [bacterium]|nr:hypothetical protein [bacterium]
MVGLTVQCDRPGCECGGDTGVVVGKTWNAWMDLGMADCCWDVLWDDSSECTFILERDLLVLDDKPHE